MISARKQNKIVRYQYDALGRRVMRHGKGVGATGKYSYDGDDVILDDGSEGVVKYQNGPGIDNKLRAQSGTSVSYFLSDHLGSTNGLTDSTGALTSQTAYDSFGNATNSSFSNRYQFTGREFDNFTGLHYYRARWYDANLGRFISEDPIGIAGGINQYSYVSNNSINKNDPLGLYERDVHYYLTRYLALQNGCFGDSGSEQIAAGNQGTDDDPATAPGFGRDFTNSYYHALNPAARAGTGPAAMLPNLPNRGNAYFGRYLHNLQDTFSHEGFSNSTYGHMFRAHGNDKTATDVDKAVRMAQVTYGAMSGYSQLKCGCPGKPWDSGMSDTVRRFAGVTTLFPNLADIDGNVYGNVYLPRSSSALNEKMRILGF
jgi:RHS repeat-associated protein